MTEAELVEVTTAVREEIARIMPRPAVVRPRPLVIQPVPELPVVAMVIAREPAVRASDAHAA